MKFPAFILATFLASSAFCAESPSNSTPAAPTAQSAQKTYTMENCLTEFDPAKTEKTAVGYQFWFANKELADGQTLKMSVVAPKSATHPPHRHIEDEFFFILEGTAEVYLNGKTKVVTAYSSFYCPSNSEHGIRNVGETILKYLVVKKYPVAAAAK